MKRMAREVGSLESHRGFLGKPGKKGSVEPFPGRASDVFKTQVKGLKARLSAIGCKDVCLGLSGGLDSTLALLVAETAFRELKLDKAGIHLYTMPGFGTTRRTKGNAEKLAEGLCIGCETISIVKACRQHFKDIGHDGKTPDITFENAQARMRTLILFDKANMHHALNLGTGDMSEIALGWCTYNGDHMSHFAVNSGVPKTIVRKVCAWWAKTNPGPAADAILDIIATPISPELIPGQQTEKTVGSYELHDFFLWNFVMNEMGKKELQASAEKYFAGKFGNKEIAGTLDIFLKRLFTQAFKRNCAPDGIKVFAFDLSPKGFAIPSDLGVPEIFR